jgi:hypothetical protein
MINYYEFDADEIRTGFGEVFLDREREAYERYVELYGADHEPFPGEGDDGYDAWVASQDAAYDVFDDAEEWLSKQDIPAHLWYDSDVF